VFYRGNIDTSLNYAVLRVEINGKNEFSLIRNKNCLGGTMLTVKDIMSTNIVSVKPDTEIIEAAKILLGKPIQRSSRGR
jgi:CBS domain-containing protein